MAGMSSLQPACNNNREYYYISFPLDPTTNTETTDESFHEFSLFFSLLLPLRKVKTLHWDKVKNSENAKKKIGMKRK